MGGVGGGGDRSPAGHPPNVIRLGGRSISVMARSRPEGGPPRVGSRARIPWCGFGGCRSGGLEPGCIGCLKGS